jgi:protein subunit release factor B
MSKELLFSVTKKDLIVQTFKAGGKGGQHQNKTDSGVRIIHKKSGAVEESRNERSQYQNKKIAFKRLTESSKFKIRRKQMEGD